MEIRDLAKEAVCISEDSTFREAISLMVRKETNTLLVTNEEGKLSGEVHIAHLLNAVVPDYLDPDKVLDELSTDEGFGKAVKAAAEKEVRDFMSVDTQPVFVDGLFVDIAGNAIANSTEQIPVVDHDNRPIGVISRKGLKHILAKYLGIKDNA